MFYFSAGVLLPWTPYWQAALEAVGALALLAYSMGAADRSPHVPLSWLTLASAALLAQIISVLGARYRRNVSEQLATLADNRVLRREMELRAEIAAARERDHLSCRKARRCCAKYSRRRPKISRSTALSTAASSRSTTAT